MNWILLFGLIALGGLIMVVSYGIWFRRARPTCSPSWRCWANARPNSPTSWDACSRNSRGVLTAKVALQTLTTKEYPCSDRGNGQSSP